MLHPVRKHLILTGVLRPADWGDYKRVSQSVTDKALMVHANQQAALARQRDAGPARRALAILQAAIQRAQAR